MSELRATISGNARGTAFATEVSDEVYDRFRRIKASWGMSCDDMVALATDDGRAALSEEALTGLMDRLEETAHAMGAVATHSG